MTRTPARPAARDDGSIVLGWLTKLSATLAILGILGFDGIALVTTTFQAEDRANSAAREAADVYRATKDVQKAYDAAVAVALASSSTIETTTFVADPTSGKITLKLHSEAATLWMHRIGPLKKYIDVSATGTGTSTS